MFYSRSSTGIAVAIFCCLLSLHSFAQEKERGLVIKDRHQELDGSLSQVKVFQLQSADPEAIVQVLSTLLKTENCRIAVDPRTKGVIVAANKKTLDMVEAILLKLDEGNGKKSSLIHLRSVSVEDAASLLSKHFTGQDDVQIVTDPRQNALLVSGSESVLKELTDFVEVIDVPATKGQLAGKDVLVYTYWIVDQSMIEESFPNWKLRDVPESIGKLVKEKLAKRTNIKTPMMAANLAIQTQVGESLDSSSVIQNEGSGKMDDNNSYEIQTSGSIWNSPENGAKVNLELLMEISLRSSNRSSGQSRIQTTISTPLNHPICLGMTPVKGIDSILVVEVVEVD